MPHLALENTLPSFELALRAGADGVEFDVHATADGLVVVHHDPSLADGCVIATTAARELQRHEAAPGIPIPTLAEVCRLVQGRAELFVELKGAGIEDEVLAVLKDYEGAAAVHSFDHGSIARAHALAPTLRLGILFEDPPNDVASLMVHTGARDVWPHASLVTPELVATVHAGGGRVITWTVNTSSEAHRLAAMGVDALCGDDVRIFPIR